MAKKTRKKGKAKSKQGFTCSYSTWNGGQGYRCRSPYTGTYIKQSHCLRCPLKTKKRK